MNTSEIVSLKDSKASSIVKFHQFIKAQQLMGDSTFHYEIHVAADLLDPHNNDILSTAVYSLGMDPNTTRGWGTRGFDMVGFLDEYIRRLANQGVTATAWAIKEKFQGALFPILLAYHPAKVDIWPTLFAAYHKVRKSYGESNFDLTILPTVNLWVHVKEFWTHLLKHDHLTVGLHALITHIMNEWSQGILKEVKYVTPSLISSLEQAAAKALDIRLKAEELQLYSFEYAYRSQNPRPKGDRDKKGGDKPNPPIPKGGNPKVDFKKGTAHPQVPPSSGITQIQDNPNPQCNRCGNRHAPPCTTTNPDVNEDTTIPFAQSEKGKQWEALGRRGVPYKEHMTLQWQKDHPRPHKLAGGAVRPEGRVTRLSTKTNASREHVSHEISLTISCLHWMK